MINGDQETVLLWDPRTVDDVNTSLTILGQSDAWSSRHDQVPCNIRHQPFLYMWKGVQLDSDLQHKHTIDPGSSLVGIWPTMREQ